MPLAFEDPRWNELKSSYGETCGGILTILQSAYQEEIDGEALGDLINEVQHQGDCSSSMFAVAPHLIELANRASPAKALALLSHAGTMYADSKGPKGMKCPKFLKEEFEASARRGADMLAPILSGVTDFDELKWGFAALAGFCGQHQFGRFLGRLDFFDGQLHHVLLDEPIPDE